jgi:DNA-directed RNA polymerase subunit RPC12/RpoP
MNEKKALHGLGCPNCGGIVPIPEGQVVVACPYCDMRSLVRGERGLQRYQAIRRVDRDAAIERLYRFLSRKGAVARDAVRKARIEQILLVRLPFWTVWADVLGWVFGQKKVRRGKNTRYEPREVKVAESMTWTGAACDVGEFGVAQIPLKDQPLAPFDAEELHAAGLVFEPVGSISDAQAAADNDFNDRVRRLAGLDRIGQMFTRLVRQRMGLVYYPLWTLRYLYRGRAFQVVVDATSGEVLYGKAPGSTFYRAAVLVGGMAAGAIVGLDGGSLLLYLATRVRGDGAAVLFGGGVALLGAGFLLMRRAYTAFRYGEQVEHRGFEKRRRRIVRRSEGDVLRAREEDR